MLLRKFFIFEQGLIIVCMQLRLEEIMNKANLISERFQSDTRERTWRRKCGSNGADSTTIILAAMLAKEEKISCLGFCDS